MTEFAHDAAFLPLPPRSITPEMSVGEAETILECRLFYAQMNVAAKTLEVQSLEHHVATTQRHVNVLREVLLELIKS